VKALIKKAVEAYGVCGNEFPVRGLLEEEIRPHVDEVRTDALGNLIARKKPSHGGAAPKVMLAAHMDEIGLMVTHVDDKGFLRFAGIGGTAPYILVTNRVVFENGTIGVIGSEKIDDIKDMRIDKLFIDIGCTDRASAEKKVRIGDMCCFSRSMDDLGDRLVSKAMDDRIACAVLVQVARELKTTENDVYFVMTVQEEIGLRGARTAAYAINPDLGLAVDVTATGDTPKSRTMECGLGQGAAIKIKDNSLMAHPKVRQFLVETARSNGIKHQMEVLEFGGTDAGAIHLTREGVPSGTISIPARYLHSPSEMVDVGDVRACVDLIVKALEKRVPF
jgi:putative aminopeptidase FrvX